MPGHLPSVHDTANREHRKILIDTFGWLPFKHWFEVIQNSIHGESFPLGC